MKIEMSSISLASQHASSKSSTVEEGLRVWVGNQRPDFEGRVAGNQPTAQSTMATISDAARQAAAQAQAAGDALLSSNAAASAGIQEASDQARNDPKIQLLVSLVESLTGKKILFFSPTKFELIAQPSIKAAAAVPAPSSQGWGMEYDQHITRRESEHTSFAAEGVIRTTDGQQIKFKLSLQMSREFSSESSVSVRQGDGVKKDPLVLNFGGNAAQLTDTKFSFDIDSDGQADQISFVDSGSGFLALDKNANGVIDNGSELFGAKSGNGFADLAAYDTDKNNWIDENDAVYSKLQVWSKDAAGQNNLSSLAQRNVGALYLGQVAAPFDLKNADNVSQGQARSAGVYLREDGSAGTLQQIDLKV